MQWQSNEAQASGSGMAWELYAGTFERPFGSVPNSAQSLAFDSAGNLFVVDAGNAIYKFTSQTVRTPFGQTLNESFVCLAFQPPGCCE